MLPLTKRGLKAGFFLVYIPSFGEFAIPELMGGDKQMFVGTVVANYILGDETGSLGAAFTLVASILLLISAILLYLLIDRLIPRKTQHGRSGKIGYIGTVSVVARDLSVPLRAADRPSRVLF